MTNVKLRDFDIRNIEEIIGRYYIRLQVPDRHGVLAGIARVFADKKVSIAAVTQKETVGSQATLVILTHEVPEKNLIAAIKAIRKLSVVNSVGNVIRILS